MQCRKPPCMCCSHSIHCENGRRRRGIALCAAPQTAEQGEVAICHHLPFKRLHVTAYSSLDKPPIAVPLLRELGQSVLNHVLPAQAQGHGTQATPNFVLRQLSDRGE